MSDLDSLRENMADGPLAPIVGLIAAIEVGQQTDTSLGLWLKEVSAEIVKLWEDSAERRDELHAVSNRLEALTRAVTTAPTEVAQRGYLHLQRDVLGDDVA